MKLYKILFAVIASVAFLTSCGSDEYYDAYTPNDTARYSFERATLNETFTPTNIPTSYSVTVLRAGTAGAVSIPVTAVFSTPAYSSEQTTLNFADGSNKATYTFTIDPAKFAIGVDNTATLSLPAGYTSVAGKSEVVVTLKANFTWVAAGSCLFTSEWVGNATPVRVQIEKAQEGTNLYRLTSLYYTLDQPNTSSADFHIQFTLDENGNAKALTPTVQAMGQEYNGAAVSIYWDPVKYARYCSFTNTGNAFTIKTIFALDGTPKYPGTETFVWDEGYPGK